MSSQEEFAPKLVIYGTTIGVGLLTVWARHLFPFALIVLGMAVIAFAGCFLSTLPLFEYMGAAMGSAAIAMVIEFDPWILVIPGLVTGYIWGHVAKDHLEGRAIDRLRTQSNVREPRKPKPPQKTTSF